MILVTGGAGYIGSHFVWACRDAGIKAAVVDDLSTGSRAALPTDTPFLLGDVGDATTLEYAFTRWPIETVVHFAAKISVPGSFDDPAGYYRTNMAASSRLIDASLHFGVQNFLFSSTAAVYAPTEAASVCEESLVGPISPYGRSKLAAEWMLADVAAGNSMRTASLRYFNVAGGDPAGRAPPGSPSAQNLIAKVCRVAAGVDPLLEIFGDDYNTRDGTCVRDFIHVSDLCNAHLVTLRALKQGQTGLVLNCGTGVGVTVREVLESACRNTGAAISHRYSARRPADIASVVAQADRIQALGWQPKFSSAEMILRTALQYAQSSRVK